MHHLALVFRNDKRGASADPNAIFPGGYAPTHWMLRNLSARLWWASVSVG
jgi:hypothetical protein